MDFVIQHIDNKKEDIADSGAEDASVPAAANSSSCHDSAIINGVTVLLAILESRKNAVACGSGGFNGSEDGGGGGCDSDGGGDGSGSDVATKQRLLDETVGAVIPRLLDFTRLLTSPPFRSPLKTTAGTLEPPLGATRLSKSIHSTKAALQPV